LAPGLPPISDVQAPKPEKPADIAGIDMLVAEYFDIADATANYGLGRGRFKRIVSKYRSSTLKDLYGNRTRILDALNGLRFPYEEVERRCKEWLTAETYECMMERVEEFSKNKPRAGVKSVAPLKPLVRSRIDLEDCIAYEGKLPGRYKDTARLQLMEKALKEARKKIKEKPLEFSFSDAKQACVREGEKSMKALKKSVIDDLSAAWSTGRLGGGCSERKDDMCPEGTAPQTKRRIDLSRGAKAAFVTFWGAQVGKVLIGGMVGAILGAGAGPAGVAAGAASGFAFGAVVPGPGPISAAAFFWASTGPLECACFPRECYYDAGHDACEVEASPNAPSKNPYGRALPYLSTKCVRRVAKSRGETTRCEIQACEEKDYAPPIELRGASLFGRIGKQDQGGNVFHCLSTNGRSSGALALNITLWNGANNTADGRVELFRAISLPQAGDSKDISSAPISVKPVETETLEPAARNIRRPTSVPAEVLQPEYSEYYSVRSSDALAFVMHSGIFLCLVSCNVF